MTNANNAANFDLDALLDGKLEDLADLPEFKPFPVGTHKCYLTLVQKKIGTHPAIEAKLKAIETIELADEAKDTPLEAGAETSVAFMLDNEYGQGALKKILLGLTPALGEGKTNRELIAEAQNIEVAVVTNLRANKDKTQFYTNIVELAAI